MAQLSILLSTYNGEKFLREQLDSILAQSFQDWVLLVRDDCSSDSTISILETYQHNNPDRIRIIVSNGENKGAKKSFSLLLQHVETPYAAFCDQDDVWHVNKLEVLMKRMKETELEFRVETPVVVFSDLEIADQNMQPVVPSFIEYSGLSSGFAGSHTILCRNVAPGCSMLFNRALVAAAGEVPDSAVMHDYWLMLVARYKGIIRFVGDKLVKYRQHSGNQLGADAAPEIPWSRVFGNFKWYLKGATFYLDQFAPYQSQAAELLKRFPDSQADLKAVKAFVELRPDVSRLKRKWNILKYGLKAGKFRENIELFLCA